MTTTGTIAKHKKGETFIRRGQLYVGMNMTIKRKKYSISSVLNGFGWKLGYLQKGPLFLCAAAALVYSKMKVSVIYAGLILSEESRFINVIGFLGNVVCVSSHAMHAP